MGRRTAQHNIKTGVALLIALLLFSCYPPPVQYPYTPMITNRRSALSEHLIHLLPIEQQHLSAARDEARWLADTAYKASAAISRVNGSHFPGWAGNALINMRLQDRGLCWHYQHDLYRELRRRPLQYFRLGCCVRDRAKASEHNCIYIAAKEGNWPDCWVLDAWMWNGRLKVDQGTTLNQNKWADLPDVCRNISLIYPVNHQRPIEYWGIIRGKNGQYDYSNLPGFRDSNQAQRMRQNILRGQREHPDSPVNY